MPRRHNTTYYITPEEIRQHREQGYLVLTTR